jgi:hypothetical protein
VTRLPPLTGISPWDSEEQKRKDSKEWLGQNRIDERCIRHHGWGVLSFFCSHLIHYSSSVILLSLGQGRASIAVGRWCRHSWSWGRWLTSTGAMISIMTFLSIVEASGVCFIRCCIRSGWGSLSARIPNIQSLEVVRAWNHLPLWGDKSLSCSLRHQLKTLSNNA